MNSPESAQPSESKDQRFAPPAVSLPKGGGAIRGIGEKFAANLVSGTGSLSIPLPASPGRSGFTPALTLVYDSGSGNGPYGLGWSINYPHISRRTDRGLPRYIDEQESDVFILSGAEDLVPVVEDGVRVEAQRDGFRVTRYRPRIEGLFARIERWTSLSDPSDTFWRSISRENVTTFYGRTPGSRVADPTDPTRIFSWLCCESFDDKGNAATYVYVAEDGRRPAPDGTSAVSIRPSAASESNRTDETRSAGRYLKRVRYGNRTPAVAGTDLTNIAWFFELVMDYGDHDAENPGTEPSRSWALRPDPFSTCRAGFEVRAYRRCQRVLMFHRFAELGTEPKLVRSLELDYEDYAYPSGADIRAELDHLGSTQIRSVLRRATLTGYAANGLAKSMPSLELTYARPVIDETPQPLDESSLAQLPIGVDGSRYQWLDLNGEGIAGVFSEQGGAWWYKPNLGGGRLGPQQLVARNPSMGLDARAQFLDLEGDGQLDLVQLRRPNAGFFARDAEGNGWIPFSAFASQPNIDWDDPNLRFADLTGDGHADVLITEDAVLSWHPSLAEQGFGPRLSVPLPLHESQGPKLVFHDTTDSIYLADMSGDGLPDLVRIRNGEVCYWPNLGYGRFGRKVTMDGAPLLDAPDLFEPRRIRLADIDGSGVVDLLYLARDGVRLYFNRSGNGWTPARTLRTLPSLDQASTIQVTDVLGSGTACLVWSTSLPHAARAPFCYVDLMSSQKPDLLVCIENNLGARTSIQYTTSTRYYLEDQRAGRPWVTWVPFPVHVVQSVETYDAVSRNRFVSRYRYHHGHYDGVEREFRGFGMVEQEDTQEFAAFVASQEATPANADATSHVPPVRTRTWFHTGIHIGRQHVSDFFAGLLDVHDSGEYYREPGLDDDLAGQLLLDDTILPTGLSSEEEREACRALKGAMLRQEVYALDGTDKEPHPYAVTEQNFAIRCLQARGDNRHAVFFTHPRESLTYQYERIANDPRTSHGLVLAVDDVGNVLRRADVAYGRRDRILLVDEQGQPAEVPNPGLEELVLDDQQTQLRRLVTYTENRVTNSVDLPDAHRAPVTCESLTYELTGLPALNARQRFAFDDLASRAVSAATIPYEEQATQTSLQKRLIGHVRTLFWADDLGAPLPLGVQQALALPYESYELAFTPGLIGQAYGDRVTQAMLTTDGGYVQQDEDSADGRLWLPSGRVFFSAAEGDAAAPEQFLLPRRFLDPFGQTTSVSYEHELLLLETSDALGNVVTVGERDALGKLVSSGNDYRTLQPRLVTDPNGNRVAASFDALGMVVGTAIMGKRGEAHGDSLDGFAPDLDDATVLADLENPRGDTGLPPSDPHALLGRASTRLIYDLFAYVRTKALPQPRPAVAHTLLRETHDADLAAQGEQTRIQHRLSYSDGFGREIQKKLQAEDGPVPSRDASGRIVDGPPVLTNLPRWVGSGWTVFDNKGNPVRQFRPFFTDLAGFEADVRVGTSPYLFYDPIGRVVATLHPNRSWQKVRFDAWRVETWDVNDTVLIVDPATDEDVGPFFQRLEVSAYSPTWFAERQSGALGPDEKQASTQTKLHADTPSVAHADALGRPFLTVAHNRFERKKALADEPPIEEKYATRVTLDIEGNQRQVDDAKARIVMQYQYDMLRQRIHQASMEAGQRWLLGDVAGKPIYSWDSRGHRFHTTYDALRRPTATLLLEDTGPERVIGRVFYGESADKNQRGKPIQTFDQAGIVRTEDYDFKGNLLATTRQLAPDYENTLDWSELPDSASWEVFTSSTRYDALNRPLLLTTPDGSARRAGFNGAGLLERIDVNLRGGLADGKPVWTPFVTNIDYEADGRREHIEYASGARTEYTYDSLTLRLARLRTRRPTDSGTDFSNSLFANPDCVQDLSYTYDPSGNIIRVADDALKTIFHEGAVDPVNRYTYDATYRLVRAEGREHIGQTAIEPVPPTGERRDVPFLGARTSPNDLKALRTYTECYEYDAAGNIQKLTHKASGATWTREYVYSEPSPLDGNVNNRLSSTTLLGATEVFDYRDSQGRDVHGCIAAINDMRMTWDFKDQLRSVDFGGGGSAYYVYDATGQRIRKVIEQQNGMRKSERIYLGEYEVYREFDGAGTSTTLERETLHVADDKQRIALIETQTVVNGATNAKPASVVRYQLGNHLGSASVELDVNAAVISYEEYHPYGTTAFQAMSGAEVSLKRYRYTGMERDEETGFAYHGARYYAPWLGRWSSADPLGLLDGPNTYAYVKARPTRAIDWSGTRGAATTFQPDELAAIGTGVASVTAAFPPVGVGVTIGLALGLLAAHVFGTGHIASTEPYNDFPPGSGPGANYSPPPTPSPFTGAASQRRPGPLATAEPIPLTATRTRPDDDERKKKTKPGRIYVTYLKIQDKTGRVYTGRTSMAIPNIHAPKRELTTLARAAVELRGLDHHKDRDDYGPVEDPAEFVELVKGSIRDDKTDLSVGATVLDVYAVGGAVNYDARRSDDAYFAIRGREQQSIDAYGGAVSDQGRRSTRREPSGNAIRGVSRHHPDARRFHDAAVRAFGELHEFGPGLAVGR